MDAEDLLHKMGYAILNWNLDTKDWQYAVDSPQTVLDRVQSVLDEKCV